MKMTEIVPAIITNSQDELNLMIEKVKNAVNRVQLDVMDGEFVPNTSLNFNFKLVDGLFYEVHLMIEDPVDWVENYADKVDLVIAHFEAVSDMDKYIETVKKKGKKVGIALNPSTSISEISSYLDKLDHVLVMTVEPGFYGSKFLPDMLNKVKQLKGKFDIEVDGGIVPETAVLAKEAGANILVSGSFIMKSDDPLKSIEDLK